MELSFPWNFRSLEHSLPWSEKSKNFCSTELSHPWNFRSSGANVPRTFAPCIFRSLELSLPYVKNWGKALHQSVCRRILAIVVGLSGNRNFRFLERKFHFARGAKVLWNFCYQERKFYRTFGPGPGSESSIHVERKFWGLLATANCRPNFLNVNYTVHHDIWNITYGDEVSEDRKSENTV